MKRNVQYLSLQIWYFICCSFVSKETISFHSQFYFSSQSKDKCCREGKKELTKVKIMFFCTFSDIDVSLLAIEKTNAYFIGNVLTSKQLNLIFQTKLEVVSNQVAKASVHRLTTLTLTLCGVIMAALVSGVLVFLYRRNAKFREKLRAFTSRPDVEASLDYQVNFLIIIYSS